MNGKERMLAVLSGKKPDKVPVFPLLMSFSSKRIQASYRDFATDGSVMAQAQLNIIEQFKIDAITACTDAFRITADLGGDMRYPETLPPFSQTPLITQESDLHRLKIPDASISSTRMYDRAKGVGEMVRYAGDKVMVFGWVDMPFAEACSLCGVQNFMVMLYDEPELAHKILEFLTPIVIDFALLQIEFGAPAIGAGDAAASLISADMYREFALPYEQRVSEAIHKKKALLKLHICGNTTALIDDMAKSGADLFNIDHMVRLTKAAESYGKYDLAFKGNLDPVTDMLFATPQECYERSSACIKSVQGYKYILSPGCEVPGNVTDEVFSAFCSAVDE